MKKTIHYLVYDIESVTDKALLNKVLYAGQGLNDEEAYQKHLQELAEDDQTFVNTAFHKPVAIAAVALHEDLTIQRAAPLKASGDRGLVHRFWEIYNEHRPILIDFNGSGYDVRLLELWAFRLGITISHHHWDKFGPRYRYSLDYHIDLQDLLTNNGAIRFRGGLDLFAKLLGKPGKMNVKGDMVQALHDQGEFFKIDDYCLSDTLDTYFVFLRTLVMRGKITLAREQELVDKAHTFLEQTTATEGYCKEYLQNFGRWLPGG